MTLTSTEVSKTMLVTSHIIYSSCVEVFSVLIRHDMTCAPTAEIFLFQVNKETLNFVFSTNVARLEKMNFMSIKAERVFNAGDHIL